jgi:hypothetical protein
MSPTSSGSSPISKGAARAKLRGRFGCRSPAGQLREALLPSLIIEIPRWIDVKNKMQL